MLKKSNYICTLGSVASKIGFHEGVHCEVRRLSLIIGKATKGLGHRWDTQKGYSRQRTGPCPREESAGRRKVSYTTLNGV